MITMMMFKKVHWILAYLSLFILFFSLLFFDIAKDTVYFINQNAVEKNLADEIDTNQKRLTNTGQKKESPLIKIDNHLIDTALVLNDLTHLFLSQGIIVNKIRLLKTKAISDINVLPAKLSLTGPFLSFCKAITALAQDKRSIAVNDFSIQRDKNGAFTAEIALWIFAVENKFRDMSPQVNSKKDKHEREEDKKLSILGQNKISLDLNEASIQSALTLLAQFLHVNLMISPAIHGTISLHLKKVDALKTFDLILMSHELSKLKTDTIWYILPLSELMQKKQQELKLKMLVDEAEPLMTRSWRLHYAKAEDIAHVLQENNHALLSSRGQVHIDVRTNILCVQDTADRLNDIQRLIQRLDVPVQQVLIEVHLASIDSDFERELGIHFVDQQTSDTDTSGIPTSSSLGAHYGLAIIKLGDGSLLNMQLSALEKTGHGELISSPSLFTANQQTASIESGEEIP